VCGRVAPNWGDERKRGLEATDDDEEDDEVAADDDPIAPSAKAELGEWKERKLCADGACIGVIGDDGTCRVCGKLADGAAVSEDQDDDEYEDDEDVDEGDDEGDDDELAAAAEELAGVAPAAEVETAKEIASSAADADEDSRKLCPDGGCIGLIGPDGKCKVCGKEAAA
jgi:hypothetical protein